MEVAIKEGSSVAGRRSQGRMTRVTPSRVYTSPTLRWMPYPIIFLIDQSEFTSSKMAGSIRTASWSPPEVLDPPEEGADWDAQMIIDGDSICTAPYSRKSDVYSLAMVFY